MPVIIGSEPETIFGPETYVGTGSTFLVERTFQVADRLSSEYTVRVRNEGAVWAAIAVNVGIVPPDPGGFGGAFAGTQAGRTTTAQATQNVHNGENRLAVGFFGVPGTSVTVEVLRSDPPPRCGITLSSPLVQGAPVVVTATPRPGVGVARVRFQSSSGTLDVEDRSAPFSAPFVGPGPGPVTFTATLFDADGEVGACSSTIAAS
jgi:hypothetical protein